VRGREGEREKESSGGTSRGWSEKSRPMSRCRWRGGGWRVDASGEAAAGESMPL
jgi:hypothetical protein